MSNSINIMDGNWVKGVFQGYKFEAKIFVEPSEFGIDNGHVSKLWVLNGKIVYERGWDVGKSKSRVWKPLVKFLEKYAKSEEFKKSLGY